MTCGEHKERTPCTQPRHASPRPARPLPHPTGWGRTAGQTALRGRGNQKGSFCRGPDRDRDPDPVVGVVTIGRRRPAVLSRLTRTRPAPCIREGALDWAGDRERGAGQPQRMEPLPHPFAPPPPRPQLVDPFTRIHYVVATLDPFLCNYSEEDVQDQGPRGKWGRGVVHLPPLTR